MQSIDTVEIIEINWYFVFHGQAHFCSIYDFGTVEKTKTFERKIEIFFVPFPKTFSGNKNNIYLWPVILNINFVCIANTFGLLRNITFSIKNYYFNMFDWNFRVLIRLREKRPIYVCFQNVSNKLSAVVFELARDMHGRTFGHNFVIKKFLGVHFFLDCEQQTFNWCCRNIIIWVWREIENFFGRNSKRFRPLLSQLQSIS